MIEFKKIESSDDIKKIIKSVSDMDLDVEGLWGYDKQSATQINSVENFSLNEFHYVIRKLLKLLLEILFHQNFFLINSKKYVHKYDLLKLMVFNK